MSLGSSRGSIEVKSEAEEMGLFVSAQAVLREETKSLRGSETGSHAILIHVSVSGINEEAEARLQRPGYREIDQLMVFAEMMKGPEG